MLKLKSVNFDQQQFQIHELDQMTPGQVEWIIGRNTTCDLVLPNPEISRTHGRILYCNDTYYFIDLDSTSGSLLNGETMTPDDQRSLRQGDILQLGETFLYIEALTPPSPIAATIPGAAVPLAGDARLQMAPAWSSGDLLCRCSHIIDETPDVKTFCLVAESPLLFSYKPGQFVNLEIEIEGVPTIRSYSISSSPSRPHRLDLTVKRVYSPSDAPDAPPGLVSNWLHDHLKIGDSVKLRGGPLGHFSCLPNLPTKLLLISAGSGITPMMSMTRWIQDTLAESDVIFLHSAKTPQDIIYRHELERMAAQMPNLHLAITATQPSGQAWMGLTGRISQAMLEMVAPDLLDRHVYVCGPDAFMQSMRTTLEAMQFPMQQYQQESFGGKKTAQPPSSATMVGRSPDEQNGNGHHPETVVGTYSPVAPAIHFSQSEREVAADGTTSILELAEQEGISIQHACRVGACGACRIQIRQGQVQYDSEPVALTSADQQAGYALACVAYPVDRVVVEV